MDSKNQLKGSTKVGGNPKAPLTRLSPQGCGWAPLLSQDFTPHTETICTIFKRLWYDVCVGSTEGVVSNTDYRECTGVSEVNYDNLKWAVNSW